MIYRSVGFQKREIHTLPSYDVGSDPKDTVRRKTAPPRPILYLFFPSFYLLSRSVSVSVSAYQLSVCVCACGVCVSVFVWWVCVRVCLSLSLYNIYLSISIYPYVLLLLSFSTPLSTISLFSSLSLSLSLSSIFYLHNLSLSFSVFYPFHGTSYSDHNSADVTRGIAQLQSWGNGNHLFSPLLFTFNPVVSSRFD